MYVYVCIYITDTYKKNFVYIFVCLSMYTFIYTTEEQENLSHVLHKSLYKSHHGKGGD